ncbi:MAG: hypothetical protein R3E42_08900 [Burkholderiaceae bacterium]
MVVSAESHRFLVADAVQVPPPLHPGPSRPASTTVILEPVGRNTAAAMALAALQAGACGHANDLLLFCPADHHIPDARAFAQTVQQGGRRASRCHRHLWHGPQLSQHRLWLHPPGRPPSQRGPVRGALHREARRRAGPGPLARRWRVVECRHLPRARQRVAPGPAPARARHPLACRAAMPERAPEPAALAPLEWVQPRPAPSPPAARRASTTR